MFSFVLVIAEEHKIKECENLCKSNPPKLHLEIKNIIRGMYESAANEFLGKTVFNSPKINDVIKIMKNS